MAPAKDTPAALVQLAIEAVTAIAAMQNPATFRAVAGGYTVRDSVVKALPSFASAKDAICEPLLVTERYGAKAEVGDRLTLQFVYQLFPRTGPQEIRQDARRLWRRFLAELNIPTWREVGVANLRNFDVVPGVPIPLPLAEGISIRLRSPEQLRSFGFTEMVLKLVSEDWASAWFGYSEYVICSETYRPKEPGTVLLGHDGSAVMAARRATTSLRLAGQGDVMMGPMRFCRSARFHAAMNPAGGSGGHLPPEATGSEFVLARPMVRTVRTLQAALAQLDASGYDHGPGNLDLALRSFDSTYARFPQHADSQLVDLMTAAEALLSPDKSEISFRLAFRVAGLLGRTPDERLKIFKMMRTFYAARSTIVHGSAPGRRERKAHNEVLMKVGDARELIRRLLVAFIPLAATPSPKYSPDFFKEVSLDAALWDDSARRRLVRDLGLA